MSPVVSIATQAIIVPLVTVQLLGTTTWPFRSISPMHWRNRINEFFEHARVVFVGTAQRDCERNSMRIHDDVSLGTELATIGWVTSSGRAASWGGNTARVHSRAAPIDGDGVVETI